MAPKQSPEEGFTSEELDALRQIVKALPPDRLKKILIMQEQNEHLSWALKVLRTTLMYIAGAIIAVSTIWGAFQKVIRSAVTGSPQ